METAPPSAATSGEKIGVIVTDIQGDFTTWKKGTLAIEGTDEAYVRKVAEATAQFVRMGFTIYATQDWHPKNHISFASNHPGKKPYETIRVDGRTQALWPDHCVQGSAGAEILLDTTLFQAVVRKAQDPRFDSYSAFQDGGGNKTELDALLKTEGITKLVIYGLATDYCVVSTAVDAVANGYDVVMIEGLSRGVAPDTTLNALETMKEKSIRIVKEIDPKRIKDL